MKLRLLFFLFVALIISSLLAFGMTTYSKYDTIIKNKNTLLNYKDKGVILTDRNGTPFYLVNNASLKEYIPLNDIPPSLQHAIIVEEDKDFYTHPGVSISGIIRSFFMDVKDKGFAYGGSTITQQLAKNTLLTSNKNIVRKLQEALLSFDIESHYSKDEILEMYINSVYYGEGAIGITNAARIYFNEKPQDLTLAQSAYLAGLLKSPSLLSPYTGDIKLGKESEDIILSKMVASGYVTKNSALVAKNEDLGFERGDGFSSEAPHFSLMVLNKLRDLFGEDAVYQGLKVKTTLDLSLQEKESEIVTNNIRAERGYGVSNASSVTIDPHTGDVLALVGSADWYNDSFGKINMAISPRSPGSSFKPIVYSIAMDDGMITPSTVLNDSPTTFVMNYNCDPRYSNCTYTPMDYDRSYRGKVTVRQALANSLNIPAVEVMQRVGLSQLLERAPSFGITSLKSEKDYGGGLSLVLGSAEVSPLEMASAYSTFANNGNRPDANSILSVEDKYGNKLYTRDVNLTPVVSEDTAFFINSILSDPLARKDEFGNLLSTPFNAAVKTGTSENFRDVWTIGYTPDAVTAVWVGNSDGTPNNGEPGVMTAAPIWKEIMSRVIKEKGNRKFAMPDDIIAVGQCDATSSGKLEYFIRGTEPSTCLGKKPDNNSPTSNISPPDINTPDFSKDENRFNFHDFMSDPSSSQSAIYSQ